ncbi:MAG: hypothetical protein KIT68_00975 [Phycisphaeraceae bacterium]|nr:hypothetical protein [Phycisphaeraceae bacterium]
MPTRPNPRLIAFLLLTLAGSPWSLTARAAVLAEPDAPEQPEPAAPGQPQPANPSPTPADQPAPGTPSPTPAPVQPPASPESEHDPLGRRKVYGEPTKLGFRNVTVDQVIPFIVESTGKVVLPQQDVMARRITLLNDRPIPRDQALDLVFLALQQVGVAVIESREIILLRDIGDVDKQTLPVLGPDERVGDRRDLGSMVQKVFALRYAVASNIGEILKPSLPDTAKMSVDNDSNQVVLVAPIAVLQKVERLIGTLDKPAAAALITETFRLRFADSEQVAANIRDLFGAGGNVQGQGNRPGQQNNRNPQQFRPGQPNQPQQGQQGQQVTSTNLRVTTNAAQNSVTVLAEATVIEKIREQIEKFWDRPLPEDVVVPRVYQLKNADPIRMKEVLDGLFGSGSQTAIGTQFGQRQTQLQQGVGRLAGQFSFQAIPEAGRLIAVSKSPDNMQVLDQIIEDLDQPVSTGMPQIIELKHATAEDLAEQLNALLAQEGTLASIRRVNTDLTARGQSAISPFSSNASTTATTNATQTAQADQLQLWWQRARPPTDTAGASNLVGKIRIVPVARQNAIMVMAPTEYREAVAALIDELDKAGRQVLIAAIIVELTSEDATALGIRFSNQTITPRFSDNAIGIQGTTSTGAAGPLLQGTKNNLLPGLFDTSVLQVGVDVNLLLQALAQDTKVTILSEPRIFTGDNQEADFFDGQDIPFITDSQVTDNGNLVQSFDYRAVGIQLRVRPRITPQRSVDLKVNLTLANLSPQTTNNGAFIVERRETTTQLIVDDGQTIVISGIMRTEDSDVKRKVPLFGDIPLIGLAFQSTERVKTKTELVAFITPVVVEGRTDMDSSNAADRARLEQLRKVINPERATPGSSPDKPPAKGPKPTIQPADQTGQ